MFQFLMDMMVRLEIDGLKKVVFQSIEEGEDDKSKMLLLRML